MDIVTLAVSLPDGLDIVRMVADDGHRVIDTTDAGIEAHLARIASSDPRYRSISGWRRISEGDLPQDRTDRNAWRDDGREVAVDIARIKPPPERDPRDVKIAALEAAVAALKTADVLTDAMIDAEREVSVKAR